MSDLILRNKWVKEYLTPVAKAAVRATETAETAGELMIMADIARAFDSLSMEEGEEE
jgi:hypothetical protein